MASLDSIGLLDLGLSLLPPGVDVLGLDALLGFGFLLDCGLFFVSVSLDFPFDVLMGSLLLPDGFFPAVLPPDVEVGVANLGW